MASNDNFCSLAPSTMKVVEMMIMEFHHNEFGLNVKYALMKHMNHNAMTTTFKEEEFVVIFIVFVSLQLNLAYL